MLSHVQTHYIVESKESYLTSSFRLLKLLSRTDIDSNLLHLEIIGLLSRNWMWETKSIPLLRN